MKMNNLFKIKTLASLFLFTAIFTGCSKEEASMESQLKVSNATAVTTQDMIGHWDLTQMIADAEVDLDENPGGSTNLLDETNCFNTMYITFNDDNTFDTNNATMTFEAGDGNDFKCLADRMDEGTWSVENGNLILTMTINGTEYVHEKEINLGMNTFTFDVTKIESNQYVNDPGSTRASEIRILELEYTKS